jgi:hypothetical protein
MPTRTETLKALEDIASWDMPSTKTWAMKVALEAAGAWVGLAPDTCPTCDGNGIWEERSGAVIADRVCAVCAGRGVVWPDTLIERMTTALDDMLPAGTGDFVLTVALVEAVLGVLWEADDATL